MLKSLFLAASFLVVTLSLAQMPTADFSLPETVCTNENIFLQNNSSDATDYLWDFCNEDLMTLPTLREALTLKDGDAPLGIAAKYDSGKNYGLITNYKNHKIFSFSSDKNNNYLYNELAINTPIQTPDKIKLHKESGEQYALFTNSARNSLVRLSLNNELNIVTSETELTGLGLNRPRGLAVTRFQNEVIAVAGNQSGNTITIVNFGSSITNVPIYYTIGNPLIKLPLGLALAEEEGSLYGFVASRSSGKITRIKFNSNLFTEPTFEEIAVIPDATEIDIVKEGNYFQAFIVDSGGRIHRLDFDNGLVNPPNVAVPIDLNVLDKIQSLEIIRNDSIWIAFTINLESRILYKLNFQDKNCSYVNRSSLQEVVPEISYDKAGTYAIKLTTYNELGNHDDTTQFITVTADKAPLIDFQSDQCFGSTSTLTATANQTLSAAHWSIKHEDNTTVTRTGQTVTYDFPTPGTYSVTLKVESANGCGNRLTKEVAIYEPPAPGFTAPAGQICSNGTVNFTNTTDAKGADNLITYRWFVVDSSNNKTLVSEAANPALTFATGGSHTVRLEAGIPGCTETFDQTIDILQGPTVSFAVPTVCQNNAVTFGNQTVGVNITGYFWDFGDPDGGTYSSVTADNPTYTFDTPGTYPVTLRVTNALGCQNVYQQSVTVYAQPTVSFLAEVACAGSPTQFTDASTAGPNANVSAWQWDFGDGIGTASIRNPTYAYRQAGTYAVKLITESTAGCVDSTVQTITVQSAVDVGFAAVRQCPTEARPLNVLLSDTSVAAAGETIDRWFWTVNGENFVSSEVEYAFPAPGNYPVSLTVFTALGCNATVQRIVSVTTSPSVAFSSIGSCTGAPVVFRGEVDAPGWGELTYAWEFVGPNGAEAGAATTANPEVVFEAPGAYAVTLTVQTDGGCTFTTTRPVTIAAAPVAIFTASPNYGGTPLEVTFANASTDATAYAWDFGGVGTSEEAEPTFTFTDVGTYVVTLTATNATGCTATAQQTVEVVLPVQDLRLDDFTVADSPSGDGQQLVLTLSNRGTRVASGVTVTVDLDESLTVEERRAEPLLPGQTVTYVTKFRLPTTQRNQRRPLRYLCARITATDADFDEARVDNNRNCLSLNEQLNVEPPFPNPASEQLRVSVILPVAEEVSLRLMDSEGKVMRTHRQETTVAGLNTFLLNVQGLPVGAYLLQVSYRGERRQFRVAVSP